ncbi:ATPase of the CDC48/PAS1/SEC18 (AAA) family [Komagataella phaffii CBS 7435]|uniref:ATPase of the CDC48/PAS1/SEC18 (AAA) family, forms a hexameric complex n=2 Tax=Komagataella phaffii TaxID=460519 RepID=C4R1I5_KOMPG|nr:ATPase of the CDC48/PAS1/SEC18 (AAA) family, forms a hexameric complex [Komagataella phaffii GS115]AOA62821.1 GQ67_00777T0 [Komagataella phaffii]CAH2448110.1 ATPase of the CDC48/PAS1/SEC18 (AAA) family [Komagataella phaffii CBS 7435]AOA68184.1 GQ68_00612T0 [Komagataella phaffii GS115]CAY69359.1 ATPase of the CDC48/PAS1/SEC18 (AAA) family, forms a hexameric complex [Komagataella phaffii GS115]CCA38255.1 ATPase of the CDC48/PAS1/SEC18 (AAA) family [Komagataella phaffii CBS 7435]
MSSKSAKKKEPTSKKEVKYKPPKEFMVRPADDYSIKDLATILLHPEVIENLPLAVGSFVKITRPGSTTGVVGIVEEQDVEDLLEDRSDIIQMTTPLRKLCSVMLGERVSLLKISKQPKYAETVTVGAHNLTDSLKEALQSSLPGILDQFSLLQPGFSFPSGVTDTDGKEINVFITEINTDLLPNISALNLDGQSTPSSIAASLFHSKSTKISISDDIFSRYNPSALVDYSQIGGLQKQIELLKTSVSLPLHQPDLFTNFGITPPRGILLHGPPGTGKTMLLRAVANEENAHVLTINGPSVISKYLGETESTIRDMFREAELYQPSIIFIDEIDALAPSRNSDDAGETESRIVASLLTLMDGMGNAGRVVLVGATNRPNAIDQALRRPGRFDQEVEVGIPDVAARYDILNLQFKKMRRHEISEQDIKEIASKTHGYVGADLVALCRETVMKAIKRGLDFHNLDSLKIGLSDVENAMLDIRPSAMREIFLETPKISWTDIGGQEVVKQKLKEMVELPLIAAESFQRLGVSAPKGLLLYGPPGCSKTLTAKALASESGLNFLAVKGPEIFNKYVGESERAIREVFRKARAAAPSIIFFDEIDALSNTRDDNNNTTASNNVLTSLLNEIDGVEELKGVVILGATNRPDAIDPALLRPGRLDRHIYVPPPDAAARYQILDNSTKNFGLGGNEDERGKLLTLLSELTEGCSGAEVVLLCQESGLAAVMEDTNAEKVELRHFQKSLDDLSLNITPEMIAFYEDFAKRYSR